MAKKTVKPRFAVCVSNENCDDLEVWKIYRVLSDEKAAQEGFLRVVDESGEDDSYPTARFVSVDLPQSVAKKLPAMSTSRAP
jgi:hypothetical protein